MKVDEFRTWIGAKVITGAIGKGNRGAVGAITAHFVNSQINLTSLTENILVNIN